MQIIFAVLSTSFRSHLFSSGALLRNKNKKKFAKEEFQIFPCMISLKLWT